MKKSLPFLFISISLVFLAGILVFAQSLVFAQVKPDIRGVTVSLPSFSQGSTVPLQVKANITTIYGIESAEAIIVDAQGSSQKTFSLYDDGKHDDGAVNDEKFGGSISISDLPPGTYSLTIEAVARIIKTKTILSEAATFTITLPAPTTPSIPTTTKTRITSTALNEFLKPLKAAKCVEVVSGTNNPKERRFNFVVIGYGFESQSNPAQKIKEIATNARTTLFKYQPFPGNEKAFNFWYVNQNLLVSPFGLKPGDSANVPYEVASAVETEVKKICPFPSITFVHLQNLLFGSNSFIYWSWPDPDNRVFVHEVGHNPFKLYDEYLYSGFFTNSSPQWRANKLNNCDLLVKNNIACSSWCSGLPKYTHYSQIAKENAKPYGGRLCSKRTQTECFLFSGCVWIDPLNPTRELPRFTKCVDRAELCKSITSPATCNAIKDKKWGQFCSWIDSSYPNLSFWKKFYDGQCIPAAYGIDELSLRAEIGNWSSPLWWIPRCPSEVGCFQGCSYYNWARSSLGNDEYTAGMMRWCTGGFNKISQRIICEEIKSVSGLEGGKCKELLRWKIK